MGSSGGSSLTQRVFTLGFFDLLVIVILFVLCRVLTEPWVLVAKNACFQTMGMSKTSTKDTLIYAAVMTSFILFIFVVIDYYALCPGGTRNFIYKI